MLHYHNTPLNVDWWCCGWVLLCMGKVHQFNVTNFIKKI